MLSIDPNSEPSDGPAISPPASPLPPYHGDMFGTQRDYVEGMLYLSKMKLTPKLKGKRFYDSGRVLDQNRNEDDDSSKKQRKKSTLSNSGSMTTTVDSTHGTNSSIIPGSSSITDKDRRNSRSIKIPTALDSTKPTPPTPASPMAALYDKLLKEL